MLRAGAHSSGPEGWQGEAPQKTRFWQQKCLLESLPCLGKELRGLTAPAFFQARTTSARRSSATATALPPCASPRRPTTPSTARWTPRNTAARPPAPPPPPLGGPRACGGRSPINASQLAPACARALRPDGGTAGGDGRGRRAAGREGRGGEGRLRPAPRRLAFSDWPMGAAGEGGDARGRRAGSPAPPLPPVGRGPAFCPQVQAAGGRPRGRALRAPQGAPPRPAPLCSPPPSGSSGCPCVGYRSSRPGCGCLPPGNGCVRGFRAGRAAPCSGRRVRADPREASPARRCSSSGAVGKASAWRSARAWSRSEERYPPSLGAFMPQSSPGRGVLEGRGELRWHGLLMPCLLAGREESPGSSPGNSFPACASRRRAYSPPCRL